MGRYDDILYLSRPVSAKHPLMPRQERAKQFMPFAALRGYDQVIRDRQEIWEPLQELGEEQRDLLDAALRGLEQALAAGKRPRVCVEYFEIRPGSREEVPMGRYRTAEGIARRMDAERQILVLEDSPVPLPMITGLTLIPG